MGHVCPTFHPLPHLAHFHLEALAERGFFRHSSVSSTSGPGPHLQHNHVAYIWGFILPSSIPPLLSTGRVFICPATGASDSSCERGVDGVGSEKLFFAFAFYQSAARIARTQKTSDRLLRPPAQVSAATHPTLTWPLPCPPVGRRLSAISQHAPHCCSALFGDPCWRRCSKITSLIFVRGDASELATRGAADYVL